LHRTAQNIAAQTVRTIERRRAREQEATAMNELYATEPDGVWEHIAPHLDAAIGELSEVDRDALLLRYFERKSAQEMAQVLGVSDEAAQKRVNRAVERLREFFAKRGVTVGASGLVVVISANAVQAAPAGLAGTLSATAVLAGTTFTTTATATTPKAIAMTTLQKTLVTAALAAAVGTGIYEARKASTFRKQVSALEQQQTALTEQLTRDREEATRQLVAARDENERLNRNTTELLRLRGEVSLLRRANLDLSAARTNSPAKAETSDAIYAAIGAATPAAGLHRLMTASKVSDTNGGPNFLGWRRGEDVPQETADQMHHALIRNTIYAFSNTATIRIVSQQMENNDLVRARVEAVEQNGKVRLAELRLVREADEWKPAININRSRSGSYGASLFLPLTPGLGPTNQ
jgi:hypothetical protein